MSRALPGQELCRQGLACGISGPLGRNLAQQRDGAVAIACLEELGEQLLAHMRIPARAVEGLAQGRDGLALQAQARW